jgi:hypothetical protein
MYFVRKVAMMRCPSCRCVVVFDKSWAGILLVSSNTGLPGSGLGVLRLWTARFHWMSGVLSERLREALT